MARILLGVTGSVAAVKAPELFGLLRAAGHEVKVAATYPSLTFFDPGELQPAAPSVAGSGLMVREQATLYLDADEWPQDRLFRVGEPVLHIELRKWADLLLVAPLDANTLAKFAMGFCDNLLTCVYRAWDLSRPVVLAPAMNTLMWQHPATARHLRQVLEDFGAHPPPPGVDADAVCETVNALCRTLHVAQPVSKRLACGDEGMGGMASLADLVAAVNTMLARV